MNFMINVCFNNTDFSFLQVSYSYSTISSHVFIVLVPGKFYVIMCILLVNWLIFYIILFFKRKILCSYFRIAWSFAYYNYFCHIR